MKKEKKSQD